jgi:hypothetical protein
MPEPVLATQVADPMLQDGLRGAVLLDHRRVVGHLVGRESPRSGRRRYTPRMQARDWLTVEVALFGPCGEIAGTGYARRTIPLIRSADGEFVATEPVAFHAAADWGIIRSVGFVLPDGHMIRAPLGREVRARDGEVFSLRAGEVRLRLG